MDFLGDDLWLSFVAMGVILGIIEMTSLELVFLMFAGGSFAAAAAAGLGAPLPIALLVFGMVSLSLMLLVRPRIVKRIHGGPSLPSGQHGLVGSTAIVEEPVTDSAGRVLIEGQSWTARPVNHADAFVAGDELIVIEIKGATAVVARQLEA